MKRGVLVGYSDPDPSGLEDNVLEDYWCVMITLDRMGVLSRG